MITLRKEYQQPAHDKTIEWCKSTNKPAIHDQSVGAGKTIQIAFFAKHVADKGGRVLCLARQGELIEQNSEDHRMIGGKCSIYSASLNRKSTYYPVVFGTEGTVARAIADDFKALKFDALLIDECHQVDWQDVINCINDLKNGFDYVTNQNDSGETKYSQYAVIIAHLLSLNPKMRIIGYTGSPYRNSKSIIGDFWQCKLSEVGTYELVNLGYLVPPIFGFGDDDHHYDLKEFTPSSSDLGQDFSAKEMAAMGRKITKEITKTQSIMEEVIERTRDRLGVLITCASKKHCEQVAECLPDGTWAIITDSTSTAKRREYLAKAKTGEIKYTIQIGCLTTGINIPYWDVCVILRRIGSLTLLIQLIGRVLRTLKPEQIESGMSKSDALILDYTDTMESMGDIYENPIVDMAMAQKAKADKTEIDCPRCKTKNSEYAVRCIGVDKSSEDGRCEYYFKSVVCHACESDNAPSAKTCRKCDAIMIDPNRDLIRKAYTDADYKPVNAMQVDMALNGNLRVIYYLDRTYTKNGAEYPEIAKEYFKVDSKEPQDRGRWWAFVKSHIQGDKFQRSMMQIRSTDQVIRNKAMFDAPTEITHRVNDKGFSIINRKRFRSGRESMSN